MPKSRPTAKKTTTSAEEHGANTPLFEIAYNRIKELIFQRKLAPGQRLIYKDLCQMLNTSRTPIINALTKLEEEGYVKSESFRGFYVKPIDIQEISDGFGVREALEAYAIEHALKRMQPADVEDLKLKIADHEAYMPPVYDKQKFYLDAAVHIRIAETTGNKGLVQLLTKNLEHVYLRLALHTHHPDRMAPAVQEHKELLQFIEAKDEAACIALMRRHIQRARDHVITSLEREETYQAL